MKRIISIVLLLTMIACTAVAATRGEENALGSALNYLSFMNFSSKGLYKQLEYEGYSETECRYAVENCGADWYEQAVGSAENYLSFMSFSKSSLIGQLEYEGFTKEEAEYGAAVAYGENPTKPGNKSTSAGASKKKQKAEEAQPTEAPSESTIAKERISIDKDFDVSILSYDELIVLERSIIKELTSRPEYKEVLVPTGAYKVGVDIPAGKWTITATEGACEVYWGKALDEYGVEIASGQRIDKLDDWGSKSSVTWELVEGTYIVINRKGVTFTPYIPISLGF